MQCHARSKKSGSQCKRGAIAGGRVCHMHGGAAPQVRAKAIERLATLVDPAIGVLRDSMKRKDKGKPDAIALAAAKDALDRNGLQAAEKVEAGLSVAEVIRTRRFERLAREKAEAEAQTIEVKPQAALPAPEEQDAS